MTEKSTKLVLLTTMLISIVITCGWSTRCEAQPAVVSPQYRLPRRAYWGAYDPYYALTARVYAQAELIRAQSDAAVGYATARNLNADAYSKELDNWQKEVRVHWDRQIIREKKKLELAHVKQISKMKYLNDRKWQNSRDWDLLKNHQELSGSRIHSGRALNFLLSRMAGTALPPQFNSKTSQFTKEALEQMPLNKMWFSHIRLKQGGLTFFADKPLNNGVSLWPYILRWDEFEPERKAFEQARISSIKEVESKGQVSVETIKKMQRELMALSNKLHGSTTVKQWVKRHRRYTEFNGSDRFLRELDREIMTVEKTGDVRPLKGNNSFNPKTDGDHVIGLLCYMNRNGIEFAPAEPGSEFAYHNLFVLMRSIYLTVAEFDESIQPKNLGEIAK